MTDNTDAPHNAAASHEPAAADAGPDAVHPWLTAAYPPDIDWSVSLRGEPLPALLERTVARHGGLTCTHFLGRTLTYAEIGALVNRTAKGLQALGVKKGVQVGLLLPNSPTFIICYYAILKAGGTVVNFNPLYTVDELSHQARDSGIALMITLDLTALFPKVEALLTDGALPRAVVCPFAALLPAVKGALFRLLKRKDIADWRRSPAHAQVVPFAKVIDNDGQPAPVTIDPDNDIAVLQYTGGTTGTPKGAMLTHSNLTINVQQMFAWAPDLEEGRERVMGILPFFHVFAMTTVMNLAVGKAAQMILMPRFELKQALKLIHATRPTVMPGVPTLYNAMMNAPDIQKYDLSALKFCVSGGAALPLEIKRGFEKLTGCTLVEGYGLSETSPVATCNPLGGPIKEGSIGLPLPGTVLSLRDLGDPDREVPLGEKGEICIAGPQVMKSYWNKPEETAKSFVGAFFRTGDVGTMDEEGFTFIVDRIKDIIIASGFNVYPRRIEEVIYEHPAVEEVTVLGIPDDYRGEAPKAYVKLRQGATATEEEIFAFLEEKLSKIEMPAAIEFRDALPKTMIGKLSKKELRAEMNKAHGLDGKG